MPGGEWLANQHFRQNYVPMAARALAQSFGASYLGTNTAVGLYSHLSGKRKKSGSRFTTPPRKKHGGSKASPARKRNAKRSSSAPPSSKRMFSKKTRTGSRTKARTAYDKNSKTKFAKMKGGRKGATRKGSKKTLRQSRKLKQVVFQRFHICDADSAFKEDVAGGRKLGYLTKTRSLLSRKALDAKSNSIVVFRLDCSERHWDPAKYRAGTQILPSKVEGAYGPPGTGATDSDYFIFEPNLLNNYLVPKLDQSDLSPVPMVKLEIPYTINALPDSSVMPDQIFDPKNYVIPNSLLATIKINMQFSHVMTVPQEITVKLVRYKGEDPIVSGDWTPKVEPFDQANQVIQDSQFQRILCNRTNATNGRYYSTLWQKSIMMRPLKVGQRQQTHRLNKTLNVNLKRSTCRKVIKTDLEQTLGQTVLPTFEVDTNMAMYNQCFLVCSSRIFEPTYVADLSIQPFPAGAPGIQERLPCLATLPDGPPAAFAGNQNFNFSNYAQFSYKGTIGIVHKVRDITRGTQYETSTAISDIRNDLAKLKAKLVTHDHESDSDEDLDIECQPDKKRHCRVTVKDGHTIIGE